MATQIYDNVYVRMDGQPLAENVSIDADLTSDDQEVMTILQGFAGISPSPDIRRISASNVVPITGMEIELERRKLLRQKTEITLQFGGSGKTCTSAGFIKSVKVSGGVGQTTKVDFEFVGEPSMFQ